MYGLRNPFPPLPNVVEVILRPCDCGVTDRGSPLTPHIQAWQPKRVALEGWKWPPPWPCTDTPFALPISVHTLQISPMTWHILGHCRYDPLPRHATDLGGIRELVVVYDGDGEECKWTWGPWFGAQMRLEVLMSIMEVRGLHIEMIGVKALRNGYRDTNGNAKSVSVEMEMRRCIMTRRRGGDYRPIVFSDIV
jgi:hypothetical protein